MGRTTDFGPGFALMPRLCLTVGTIEFRTGFGPLKESIFGLEFLSSAQGTSTWGWGKYVAAGRRHVSPIGLSHGALPQLDHHFLHAGHLLHSLRCSIRCSYSI